MDPQLQADFQRKMQVALRTRLHERERRLKRAFEWVERQPFPAEIKIAIDPAVPEGQVLVVPPRKRGESMQELMKRCTLITNIGP